jgi:hypothetical protein
LFSEYETGNHISSKKNQQRLDNSYLKIKIKIIDSKNASLNNKTNNQQQKLSQEVEQSVKLIQQGEQPTSTISMSMSPKHLVASTSESVPSTSTLTTTMTSTIEKPNLLELTTTSNQIVELKSSSPIHQITTSNPGTFNTIPVITATSQSLASSHSRNSSISTTSSVINPNNCLNVQNAATVSSAFVNGHYR